MCCSSLSFFLITLLRWLLFPLVVLALVTVKGGSSQACAACKYQRRRCTPECPLAPHFPADQPKIFQNAHRLFGVANMSRILKQIDYKAREDAMQSIKFESNMWKRFPYNGCCAVIGQLFEQVQAYRTELCYVQSLIDMVRNESHRSSDGFRCGTSSSQPLHFQHSGLMQRQNQHDNETELKPLWTQQRQRDVEPQYDAVSEALVNDDDDDTRLYTETKEACNSRCLVTGECSKGSNLKDRMQTSVKGAAQNELKNAAAWFSLTSFNR